MSISAPSPARRTRRSIAQRRTWRSRCMCPADSTRSPRTARLRVCSSTNGPSSSRIRSRRPASAFITTHRARVRRRASCSRFRRARTRRTGLSTTSSTSLHEARDLATLRAVRPRDLEGGLGVLLPANYLPQNYTDDLPSVQLAEASPRRHGAAASRSLAPPRRSLSEKFRSSRMQIELARAGASLVFAGIKKPSITGATRLETQPTAVRLKTGLQAPVADPLWLLTRQWQFNEFQGEDAGTPLAVKFAVKGTPRRCVSRRKRSAAAVGAAATRQCAARSACRSGSRVENASAAERRGGLAGAADGTERRGAHRAAHGVPARHRSRRPIPTPTRPGCSGPRSSIGARSMRRSSPRILRRSSIRRGQLSALPAALSIAAGETRRGEIDARSAGSPGRPGSSMKARAKPRPVQAPRGSAIAWSTRSRSRAAPSRSNPTNTPTATSTGRISARPHCPRSRRPPLRQRSQLRGRAPPSFTRALSGHADGTLLGVRGRQRQLRGRRSGRHRPATTDRDRIRAHVRQRLVRRAGAAAGRRALRSDGFEVTDTFGISAQPRPIQAAGASPWTHVRALAPTRI